MAVTDKADSGNKGPSLIIQLALLAGLTAAAAGTGWLAGGNLAPPVAGKADEKSHAAVPGWHEVDDEPKPTAASLAPNVVPIEPMTVNLASPSSVWARLEVSLVFDGPPDTGLAEAIHQDLFAYLRTVNLEELQSASGFQHLKSDMEERASIRSGGKVKRILVRTMLFE